MTKARQPKTADGTDASAAIDPVALMLLCMRLCDVGDDVSVLQHTAGQGTVTRSASWPFRMKAAEQLPGPPERTSVPLPDGLEDLRS